MTRARVVRHLPPLLALALLAGALGSSARASSRGNAQIVPGTPDDPAYVRQLAEGHYLEGELAAAAELYYEVARLSAEPADQSAALVNAAWLRFLIGERPSALDNLRAALRAMPELQLDARLFNGEFERLFLEARVMTVRESRVGLRAPAPAPHTENAARAAYAQAVERQRLGDTNGALELLDRAATLAYSGEHRDEDLRRRALSRLGLLYFERGQWSDAANAYQQAVELDRSDVAGWTNLGLARAKAGEDAAAVEAFREAYTRRPASRDAAIQLAQALIRQQRWDDAVSWISDAVRHHEREAHLHLLLADAHRGRGTLRAAAEAWRATMDLDLSFDWEHGRQAALHLGLAALRAGRPADTAEVARRALDRDATSAVFWNLLGLAQQDGGDPAAARVSFEQACENDERRAEYRNNLGRAYAAIGDLAAAEQEFVHALTLQPDMPSAQTNLARVRRLLNGG